MLFCYQNCSDLFWDFFLKIFGLQPRISKVFSRSLEQFFLTVGQNNFGNKISLFVFSDPAGDTRNRIKTSSLEIGFLGIKILLVCYESQLNKEWFRIARTIKDMGNRSGPQVFSKIVPNFCSPTYKIQNILWLCLLTLVIKSI